ncbi:heavy-metal-associated domain-containing protein [Aromatoleum toluclasticum]|uniref:heavy-metal-associated domain-containing protein n=1 Tax=Aromatoleum toluclasticum TaxID=92003 RepID=UPI000360D4A0|nr:heavy-metal-associated domain-containing protein [Aromatoleum toluclasticum]
MTTLIDFQVIGDEKIHCSGCETRIGFALRRLPGVRDVQASANTQRIAVSIDPEAVSADEVRARLQALGYEVAS